MKTMDDRGPGTDLGALRQRIEAWRRTRRKRTRMPERLWDAAAALARQDGISKVSRVLGVGYEGLKRRVTTSEPATTLGIERAAPGGFVELNASDLLGAVAGGGTVMEITSASGARLTIRFGDRDAVDAPAVADAFLRRVR